MPSLEPMEAFYQRRCAKFVYVVPPGLKELMTDISREVLRHQPREIYCFIADYLDTLLITRENAKVAARLVEDITEKSICIADLSRRIRITRHKAEAAAKIIQRAFRKHLKRKKNEPLDMENILQKIVRRAGITYFEAERATIVIQRGFRSYKVHMAKLEKMEEIDWRIASRRTIGLLRDINVSPAEMKRAATLIKATYKGYYTRRMLKSLVEKCSRCVDEVFSEELSEEKIKKWKRREKDELTEEELREIEDRKEEKERENEEIKEEHERVVYKEREPFEVLTRQPDGTYKMTRFLNQKSTKGRYLIRFPTEKEAEKRMETLEYDADIKSPYYDYSREPEPFDVVSRQPDGTYRIAREWNKKYMKKRYMIKFLEDDTTTEDDLDDESKLQKEREIKEEKQREKEEIENENEMQEYDVDIKSFDSEIYGESSESVHTERGPFEEVTKQPDGTYTIARRWNQKYTKIHFPLKDSEEREKTATTESNVNIISALLNIRDQIERGAEKMIDAEEIRRAKEKRKEPQEYDVDIKSPDRDDGSSVSVHIEREPFQEIIRHPDGTFTVKKYTTQQYTKRRFPLKLLEEKMKTATMDDSLNDISEVINIRDKVQREAERIRDEEARKRGKGREVTEKEHDTQEHVKKRYLTRIPEESTATEDDYNDVSIVQKEREKYIEEQKREKGREIKEEEFDVDRKSDSEIRTQSSESIYIEPEPFDIVTRQPDGTYTITSYRDQKYQRGQYLIRFPGQKKKVVSQESSNDISTVQKERERAEREIKQEIPNEMEEENEERNEPQKYDVYSESSTHEIYAAVSKSLESIYIEPEPFDIISRQPDGTYTITSYQNQNYTKGQYLLRFLKDITKTTIDDTDDVSSTESDVSYK